MIFFILVGGAPGTIWDHIKPKNGTKKGPKMDQKIPKIGQVGEGADFFPGGRGSPDY